MPGFLTSVWHMAGWAGEVAERGLSRRLCGRLVLIFRRRDGSLAAMDDRCPHRFVPLSMGSRDGDVLTCGYHGLSFDSEGRCVHNPFGDRIPSGARVRTYPVVERNGIIWYWPGDPAEADESRIADFPFLDAMPSDRLLRGYTNMAADYEYGTDNLMDLSHIEFVHKGSFGGAGVIFSGRHEVVERGETLHSNWWMPDVPAPAHTIGLYPPDMRTDHWLDMRWNAPATMHLSIGATPAASPRAAGVIVDQAHILTPESEERTHYFWATTTALPLETPEMAEQFRAFFAHAFDAEDKPIIEAAYANAGSDDFWGQKPVFLGVDAGGTRARRQLEAIRRREMSGGGPEVG